MKVMNMQETAGNVKYEESTRNFDEKLKEAQRIADEVDKSLKQLQKHSEYERNVYAKLEAEKEKEDFDESYEAYCKKHGYSL
ncbi:hypothetical protein QUG28_06185 [Bacillus hominis]|uniref:hypothetical protein n=1 Tax=Bacillus hominis TaxID=2817478 RepID=UPI0025A00E51|nr:hypothetical protein [Bacillus hominis]MDM5432358.1 hypothetical protein [Bacillus hominis]